MDYYLEKLEKKGVKVFVGYEVVEDEEIYLVKEEDEVIISNALIVEDGHRLVDETLLKCILDNGLVFNGRLIIQRNYQTTD